VRLAPIYTIITGEETDNNLSITVEAAEQEDEDSSLLKGPHIAGVVVGIGGVIGLVVILTISYRKRFGIAWFCFNCQN
jgi:hypothetical protein